MENTIKQRRSSIKIMGKMIGLVKPLAHIMVAAVILGTLGYLCAIFLTITAGYSVLLVMKGNGVTKYLIILIVLAMMRGILHYAEQYCNHFIAFKLLAIIRHQVFAALRKLCPAKLDGKEKGNLISIITTDIELLEVFYAHTISPIMIAVFTSLIMIVFIGRLHVYAGIFALCAYLLVGCVIPLRNGKKGGQKGMEFRSGFGNLNSFVLESLRGIDETIQYGQGEKRSHAKSRHRSGDFMLLFWNALFDVSFIPDRKCHFRCNDSCNNRHDGFLWTSNSPIKPVKQSESDISKWRKGIILIGRSPNGRRTRRRRRLII